MNYRDGDLPRGKKNPRPLLVGVFEFTETNRELFVELFIARGDLLIVHRLEEPSDQNNTLHIKQYVIQVFYYLYYL